LENEEIHAILTLPRSIFRQHTKSREEQWLFTFDHSVSPSQEARTIAAEPPPAPVESGH